MHPSPMCHSPTLTIGCDALDILCAIVPLHKAASSGVDGGAGLSEAAAVRVDPGVLFKTYNMSAVRGNGELGPPDAPCAPSPSLQGHGPSPCVVDRDNSCHTPYHPRCCSALQASITPIGTCGRVRRCLVRRASPQHCVMPATASTTVAAAWRARLRRLLRVGSTPPGTGALTRSAARWMAAKLRCMRRGLWGRLPRGVCPRLQHRWDPSRRLPPRRLHARWQSATWMAGRCVQLSLRRCTRW